MKNISLILILIYLVSCSEEKRTNSQDVEIQTLTKDTFKTIDIDSSIERDHSIITSNFLSFIKHIDRSGYIFKYDRFLKTYRNQKFTDTFHYKTYTFYNFDVQSTVPFAERQKLLWNVDESDSILINLDLLLNAKSVVAYHFESKENSTYNGQKVSHDGIIEEWTFNNSNSAELVAEEIGSKESTAYMNRGAYVCFKDNRVYIFHSRAAGFYTPLLRFFEYYVSTYDMKKANNGRLRSNY